MPQREFEIATPKKVETERQAAETARTGAEMAEQGAKSFAGKAEQRVQTTHGTVETRPTTTTFTTLDGRVVTAQDQDTVYVLDEGRVIRYTPGNVDADGNGWLTLGGAILIDTQKGQPGGVGSVTEDGLAGEFRRSSVPQDVVEASPGQVIPDRNGDLFEYDPDMADFAGVRVQMSNLAGGLKKIGDTRLVDVTGSLFGATRDGTDSTAEIQAAGRAAEDENAHLYFPQGDFAISGSVDLQNNQGAVGAGKWVTTIHALDLGLEMFNCRGRDITVRDLAMTHDAQPADMNTANGNCLFMLNGSGRSKERVRTEGAQNISVLNCRFFDTPKQALQFFRGVLNFRLINCDIENVGRAGFVSNAAYESLFLGNRIIHTGDDGIGINGTSSDNRIIGNYFRRCGAMLLDNASGGGLGANAVRCIGANNLIQGNNFDQCWSGIQLNYAAGTIDSIASESLRTRIIGNAFYNFSSAPIGSQQAAIAIEGAQEPILAHNHIEAVRDDGSTDVEALHLQTVGRLYSRGNVWKGNLRFITSPGKTEAFISESDTFIPTYTGQNKNETVLNLKNHDVGYFSLRNPIWHQTGAALISTGGSVEVGEMDIDGLRVLEPNFTLGYLRNDVQTGQSISEIPLVERPSDVITRGFLKLDLPAGCKVELVTNGGLQRETFVVGAPGASKGASSIPIETKVLENTFVRELTRVVLKGAVNANKVALLFGDDRAHLQKMSVTNSKGFDLLYNSFSTPPTIDSTHFDGNNERQKRGTASFSGDGAQTSFSIETGSDKMETVNVTPLSASAANVAWVGRTGTQLVVHYDAAPAVGTDNVMLAWEVDADY